MPIDSYSRTTFTPAFAALVGATGGATGTITGTVVDTAGYRSNTLILLAGLQSATASMTPVVLSGTVTGTLTSCAAAELIGTEAALASGFDGALTTPGAARAIGYIGTSRYVRVDAVVADAATGVYAGVWVQGDAMEPQ